MSIASNIRRHIFLCCVPKCQNRKTWWMYCGQTAFVVVFSVLLKGCHISQTKTNIYSLLNSHKRCFLLLRNILRLLMLFVCITNYMYQLSCSWTKRNVKKCCTILLVIWPDAHASITKFLVYNTNSSHAHNGTMDELKID